MRCALRLLALLVAAAVLSACGDDDESVDTGDGAAAMAAEYRPVEVTEAGAPRSLVAGTAIALRFDGGRVRASLGCNQLGGPHELDGGFGTGEVDGDAQDGLRYQLDGDRLVLSGAPVRTQVACPDVEEHVDRFWPALVGEDGRVVTSRATD